MTKIHKGKFEKHVAEMLGDKLPTPLEEIKYVLTFEHDSDARNKYAREVFYKAKREMLLKLATPSETKRMKQGYFLRGGGFSHPQTMLCWDMTKRTKSTEDIVGEVILSLRTSLRAMSLGIPCLAHFNAFEKNEMWVTLLLDNPATVNLRAVIGNILLMEKQGQKIIVRLLEAVLELERQKFYLRRIQPMSTFLSDDYEKVVFVDLRNALTEGERGSHIEDFHYPYDASFVDEFSNDNKDSSIWDYYSVGMIVLEILVGTEIVV